MAHYDKASLRSLTKSEMDQLEHLKLCILCGIEPFIEIDADIINSLLKKPEALTKTIVASLKIFRSDFNERNDRQPSIDEVRQMHVSAYALSKTT